MITTLPPLNHSTAVLREMTLHDVEQVHRAEARLFPADAWPLEMFLAEITHPTRAYVVIEEAGTIAGYAGAMCVADTADIQTIAVLPEYEGQGWGRAMLHALHTEVHARGAERILLEVRADNLRAQDLYQRNGYRQIHIRRGYYNDGVDALIMEKAFTHTSPNPEPAPAPSTKEEIR